MIICQSLIFYFRYHRQIYAFLHYFDISCYAHHSKSFEKFEHIHNLLAENSFTIEHENMFYSSKLNSIENTLVNINWHNMTS